MRAFIKELPVAGGAAKSLATAYREIRGKILARFFYLKNKKFLYSNRALEKTTEARRCFILATGPSIKTQDLSVLSGELCISISNFFVHPDFKKIRPEFHVFAASHDPITDDQMVAWLKDAEAHFPDGQKVFLSVMDKYLVDKFELFKKQRVYYYHVNDAKKLQKHSHISLTEELPKIITIPQTALYIAICLGVKEIYLLGVDHDWLLHIGQSKHFYEETQSALVNKGYVETVAKKETDLEKDFASSVKLWRQYRKIKEYALANEIEIWNSTPNSLLDVFPRKSLENALHEKKS